MLHTDVLILGAGPAGAATALNLAPHHRVLLVDRLDVPVQRIGESLPPAARRLLADMGLLDEFLLQGHSPCHGNRSVWGGRVAEQDFLRDPDGHGWHLDRARFESWLREKAVGRGAALFTSASITAVAAIDNGWQVGLKTLTGPCELHAKVLIDAGGRAATLARKLGARRCREDKLICGWLYGRDYGNAGDGLSHIEADEHGWWYSASLPNQRRVLAFHTDSDLPIAKMLRSSEVLVETAQQLPGLGLLLQSAAFIADTDVKFTAAHSATLTQFAGPGWFAVGDAALGFDPLSSQGLFNALYTGLAAAEACDRGLRGDATTFLGYDRELDRIADAYRRHLAFWYGEERRWMESLFWNRRSI